MGKGKQPAKSGRLPGSRAARGGRDFWIYILLGFAVLVVYGQAATYDFVSYDDPEYGSGNPQVRAGLSAAGLAWAFTTGHAGNWFPLTWISHMADWQLFGDRSGLHHLTNVLFHLLGTLLLYAVLKRMTGSRGRSALVAALFALHPLHVESVAWVAERKDVLCAFFWFLTMWGYLRYVEQPGTRRYFLVLVPFCLGLMSKPMMVTLPFALLLLDVWPLRRIVLPGSLSIGKPQHQIRTGRESATSLAAVLLEKAPLMALAAASALVTYLVQRSAGAVMPLNWIPFGTRLANALVTYVVYLGQMVWPLRLAAFYPHPVHLPVWQVAGAGLILLAVTVVAVCVAGRMPSLAVGWLWYLGTLVPVIGLVQVGMQARADRYTYIPLVGIFIMLAWGVPEALGRWPQVKPALAGLAVAACSACVVLASYQVQNWKDGASLYQHAIEVTTDNYVAYCGLGGVMKAQERYNEASLAYLEAIRIVPLDAKAYGGLADVLLRQGKIDDSIKLFREAVRLAPDSTEARRNLENALSVQAKSR
jgi:protein O-mannosyl-transferase